MEFARCGSENCVNFRTLQLSGALYDPLRNYQPRDSNHTSCRKLHFRWHSNRQMDKQEVMRQFAIVSLLFLATACKPPPTDADMQRDLPEEAVSSASAPLPSPDSEGANWVISSDSDLRIIYGLPAQPVLLALECLQPNSAVPQIQITRYTPADEGAGALLALVGNGHIGRIQVDATEIGGRDIWQGSLDAARTEWEPLAGPRDLNATVPGGGMVTLNPSPLPGQFVEACRTGEDLALLAPVEEASELEVDPLL